MENQATPTPATPRLFRAYLDVSDRLRTRLFLPFLSIVLDGPFFARQHILCECQGFFSLRGILETAAREITRATAFAA
jgi:hypothetical protein